MRALTPKQREALTELASGDQPTLYHRQYAKTAAALVSRGLVERTDAGQFVLTSAGREALTTKTSGRTRLYSDEADKQREYRRRKEQAEYKHRHELERIKAAAVGILREQGDYLPDEGAQGIINGLYRLHRAAQVSGPAAQAVADFPIF